MIFIVPMMLLYVLIMQGADTSLVPPQQTVSMNVLCDLIKKRSDLDSKQYDCNLEIKNVCKGIERNMQQISTQDLLAYKKKLKEKKNREINLSIDTQFCKSMCVSCAYGACGYCGGGCCGAFLGFSSGGMQACASLGLVLCLIQLDQKSQGLCTRWRSAKEKKIDQQILSVEQEIQQRESEKEKSE